MKRGLAIMALGLGACAGGPEGRGDGAGAAPVTAGCEAPPVAAATTRPDELRPTDLPLGRTERIDDPASGWWLVREADVRPNGTAQMYERVYDASGGQVGERVSSTPRDLATYVATHKQRQDELAARRREEQATLERRFAELALGACVPNGELGALRLAFARYFAAWDLALPDDAVAARKPGRVRGRSWNILFRWGRDDARGELVEVFATNRFTNTRHERFFADGTGESLATSEEPPMPAELRALDEQL